MKSYLLLLTFAAFFTSCSSVYKSGQTPDDVYYSPERQRDEYVRVEERNERRYSDDELSREDRYLRMKARNRRYGLLENDYEYYTYNGSNYNRYDDYYRINRYGNYNSNLWLWNIRYGNPYYNPYYYNPYYYNPYHNNPYYAGTVYGNTSPVYNKPRTSNLHVFDRDGNSSNPNVPRNNGRTYSNNRSEENYRGSGTNAGGFLRNTFGNNNSNTSTNSSSEASKSSSNSNSNSNSSSSSSSSSGSSRAPVRRF